MDLFFVDTLQYTELICNTTIIDLPASPTYAATLYLEDNFLPARQNVSMSCSWDYWATAASPCNYDADSWPPEPLILIRSPYNKGRNAGSSASNATVTIVGDVADLRQRLIDARCRSIGARYWWRKSLQAFKLEYSFLFAFAFRSNYGRNLSYFVTIDERDRHPARHRTTTRTAICILAR